MKRTVSISVSDIILLVLSLVLALGARLAFHACAPKADGSWMSCHGAELVVSALGGTLAVLSVARFFVRDGGKAGLSLSFIAVSVVTALVPGLLVPLCMMKDMRCHTVMRPAVIVLAVLIAAISLVDVIRLRFEATGSTATGRDQ